MLFCTDIAHGGIEMSDQDFRERVLESLSRIEAQAKENNTRLGTLERDVGWIKGKLEGSREGNNKGPVCPHCMYRCRRRDYCPYLLT